MSVAWAVSLSQGGPRPESAGIQTHAQSRSVLATSSLRQHLLAVVSDVLEMVDNDDADLEASASSGQGTQDDSADEGSVSSTANQLPPPSKQGPKQ
jgi:hypothetical protein